MTLVQKVGKDLEIMLNNLDMRQFDFDQGKLK
jgi:hypothetical protein